MFLYVPCKIQLSLKWVRSLVAHFKLKLFTLSPWSSLILVGSQQERKAVEFAYKFSTRREYEIYNADKEDVEFSLEVLDNIAIGDSFDVKVVALNKSYEQRNVKVNITSVMAFYTGIPAKPLKRKMEAIEIGPNKGTVDDYIAILSEV